MNRVVQNNDLKSVTEQAAFAFDCYEPGMAREWYAVYTIVRHEKAVYRSIEERGIETFLPMKEIDSQWTDRKKRIQLPLFPGYLFVRVHPLDTLAIFQVLNTRGVVRILSANGRLQPIPDDQIDSVKRFLEAKIESDPYQYFEEGKEVRVINGPLAGITGKILSEKGDKRLVISIDIIKRSVAVDINTADIELV
ncbi:MAG: UpxY family transcription antiterminator [Candidatus Dadabacteria bacterium]|nr:MAG: UpxY family transcription antiterminator [Candidatus Dadabacteria bacterium]